VRPRLQPSFSALPSELGGIEAAIFKQTVASVATGHFAPEDMALLCAYARASP
jgi:hypothetical protein